MHSLMYYIYIYTHIYIYIFIEREREHLQTYRPMYLSILYTLIPFTALRSFLSCFSRLHPLREQPGNR